MNEFLFLKNRIVEVDSLLAMIGEHPFMTQNLRDERQELIGRLERLAVAPPKNDRVVLYFAGGPVIGSWGINAKFSAEAIGPFADMVKAQYSSLKHGSVGARGKFKDKDEADLALTGLPRGSFGLELSAPDVPGLFGPHNIALAMEKVASIIDASSKGDAPLADALRDAPARILPSLKKFLETVAGGGASMRVAIGDSEIRLSEKDVADARDRIQGVKMEPTEETITGVFRGATLDSWRFDFRLEDDTHIGGRLGENLEEVDVASMNKLTNLKCMADMLVTVISTPTGERRSYVLRRLEQAREKGDGLITQLPVE